MIYYVKLQSQLILIDNLCVSFKLKKFKINSSFFRIYTTLEDYDVTLLIPLSVNIDT